MPERSLGVRLFQRSTRKLVLTEAGERFLPPIGDTLGMRQAAIADASSGASEPAGVPRASLSPTFGTTHILPLLPEFLARYPREMSRPPALPAPGLRARSRGDCGGMAVDLRDTAETGAMPRGISPARLSSRW